MLAARTLYLSTQVKPYKIWHGTLSFSVCQDKQRYFHGWLMAWFMTALRCYILSFGGDKIIKQIIYIAFQVVYLKETMKSSLFFWPMQL
jgi:hypothetical protein